jgi:HlyD family secretion protein
MHRPPPIVRLIVLVVVVAIVGVGAWYYLNQQSAAAGPLTASGTMEADSVTIAPLLAGRVTEVIAEEGAPVQAGSPLVKLDGATLEAQRGQLAAQVAAATASATALEQNTAVLDQQIAAADANVASAQANLELLEAGPSDEQLAVAQANVDAAQVAVDNLDANYADLSSSARDTPAGKALKLQRDSARAALDTAIAQQQLTSAGARPEQITAAGAQVDAAQAQADALRAQKEGLADQVDAAKAQASAAQASLDALDTQIAQLTLVSPIDGVVLTRSIEPGEFAAPGAALMAVGALDDLKLTVYVPEDRYGALSLGQQASVSVDSFPGETFTASIARIADQAEFTPRNVQTVEGRKSTVFAIELDVPNADGRLKPGMPADVVF